MKISIKIMILIFIIFSGYKLTNFFISSKTTVNDTIFISKYTGERVNNTEKKPVEVIYLNDKDSSQLKHISDADIVFEYLSNGNRTIYKAIFHDNYSNKVFSQPNTKIEASEYIPDINFVDNIDIPKYYTKPATSLFITFNEYTSSNFLYMNNQYHHFKDTIKDKDLATNSPVAVSNIIVQFIDDVNIKGNINNLNSSGTGLIFSGGNVIDIKWNKEKDKPIKIEDFSGNDVSMARGHTWWVIINKNASVAYN